MKFIFGTTGQFVALMLAAAALSCQKADKESADTKYQHPNASGGMSNVPAAVAKTVAKSVSLTADTVLTLGSTTVTIPAGTLTTTANATLTS
jgi:hypothetical protein